VSPLPDNTRPESVEWITSNALALVEDQQRRAESLQTRAGQIAGFAGATVALGAPLGLRAVKHLDGLDQKVVAGLYFAAVAALTLTIVLSVVVVLLPVRHYALGASEIKNYIDDARFVTQSPAEIQFRTLKGLHPVAERYETVNGYKATGIKVTAALFLVGLLLTVAVAITLAANQL
jgi:hypothetical protein